MEEDNEPLFAIATMPPSRPAHYYLCYLDGCVFIDFNHYGADQVQLVRISFDGYGCCHIADALPMPPADAIAFKAMMKAGTLDQAMLFAIIRRTMAENRARLWEDALTEYNLL